MAQQPQGALATSPGTTNNQNKKFKYTLKELVGRQAAGKELGPKQIARLQKAGMITPSPVAPTPYLTPEQQMQRLGTGATQGIEQQMGYIQGQGAFQPGSFEEQMNKAYGSVMGQFERTQAPEFARQQAEFRQMAAERGLDPNSEAYKTMQSQLNQSQEMARQNAMSTAQQAAQQVQAQGFGQAAQQYQMPASMLGAYNPYLEQMAGMQRQLNQQQFLGGESELERQNRITLENLRGQFGTTQAQIGQYGQLSYEQQRQLQQDRLYGLYANTLLEAQSQPRISSGAALASGLAQGIGSGLTSNLGGGSKK